MEDPQAAAKRLLMICYFYPPIQAVGAVRSIAFARNLTELGWQPSVLTVSECKDPWVNVGKAQPPGEIPVTRSGELGLGRFCDFLHGVCCRIGKLVGLSPQKNWFREFLCIPDAQLLWPATLRGVSLARTSSAVYVSCSPFSAALQGAIIKGRTGKPLIVDLRDPWSVNTERGSPRVRKKMQRLLERWVLSRADLVILNTPGTLRMYEETFPEFRSKLTCIPNGYDTLAEAPPLPAGSPFRIVHTGTFYGGRSPDLLLDALNELDLPDLEFVHVGSVPPGLKERGTRFKVTCTGPVPPAEAREWMSKASLLYLKQGPEYPHAVAAKTYEYMATGRPILADAPPGDNAQLVSEYAPRSYVVTSGSKEDLRRAVEKAYHDRNLPAGISGKFIQEFSRKRLAEVLSERISALTAVRGQK